MVTISREDSLIVEATCKTVTQAVLLCRRLEQEADDGYSRCGWIRGRLVADADGIVEVSYLETYARAS